MAVSVDSSSEDDEEEEEDELDEEELDEAAARGEPLRTDGTGVAFASASRKDRPLAGEATDLRRADKEPAAESSSLVPGLARSGDVARGDFSGQGVTFLLSLFPGSPSAAAFVGEGLEVTLLAALNSVGSTGRAGALF